MVDMHIAFSPPDITEEEITEVAEALRSGWITTGPRTKQFENNLSEFLGTNKTVCLNSATAAAEMTLRVLGIGHGDEVITTAYTYTATASVIAHVGAKIIMIDTAKDSYEMDYQKMLDAITEKTKAIIPVDLAGVMCDYDTIRKIVEAKAHLFHPSNELQRAIGHAVILTDGAHALGAQSKGRKCGQVADFTSFSFHAVKNLTTAEGGAVTWRSIPGVDDEELYKKYMLLSLHGQSKDALAKTKLGAWEYDVAAPYFKCNMTDIMAAIGLVQLKRYPNSLNRRREIITRYDERLKNYPVKTVLHYTADSASSGHLYLVRLLGKSREETNAVIEQMAEKGIATNVHYKPLPLLSAYRNMGFDIADYPNAYAMFENEITLPLHTKLTDEEVEYILDAFCECIG